MSPDSKRADASRNASRLLAAARALIEESGNDVALDEVARRAGVGNATLYRHFPTRADLLAAVYADEVAVLCDRAAALSRSLSPAEALFGWLEEFVVHVATKRPLAQAATAGPAGRRTPLFDEWHAAITAAASSLVDAAPLRPGVTTADVLALTTGAALAAGGPDEARRLVALLRDGLIR